MEKNANVFVPDGDSNAEAPFKNRNANDEAPPPPKFGCTVVFGFYVRLACYLLVALAAAIAAGTFQTGRKHGKHASNSYVSCPLSLKENHDHNKWEQGKDTNCDFFEFASLASCCCAFLFLAFTIYKVYTRTFVHGIGVVFELVMAALAAILSLVAALVALIGLNRLCKSVTSDGLSCKEAFSYYPKEYKQMYNYLSVASDAAWAYTVGWIFISLILLWRFCAAHSAKSKDNTSYEFENPNRARTDSVI